MKKAMAVTLCALLLVFAVYGVQMRSAAAESAAEPTAAPASEAEPAEKAPENDQAYGEKVLMEADQNGFAAEIAYPSGFEEADIALEKWAADLIKQYEEKAEAEPADKDGMKAQLYVIYNSYELGDRYVGVKEIGIYSANASENAEDVVYTLNFDSEKTKLLSLNDVIAPAHTDAVAALLTEKLKEGKNLSLLGDKTAVAADDMQHFVITDAGLLFIFCDGKLGYAEVLLDYETLLPYLSLFDADATQAPADATPTPAPAAEKKPAIVEEATCVADGVHVRAEAGKNAKVLAALQKGAVLEVVKQDAGEGYTEIWYNGSRAYVWTAYLFFTESAATAGELPEVTATGYITGNGVHVREEASTRSKVLGTLEYNAEIKIIAVDYTHNWHQILFKGQIAYINARYVSVGEKPSETPKPTTAEPKIVGGPPHIAFVGTCKTNGVIIRSSPSTRVDYYGKLYSGDQVQVIESEYRSGWDKVWIPTNNANTRGYVGYVHSKYIENWGVSAPAVRATSHPIVPAATPLPVVTGNPYNLAPGVSVNP